MDNFKNRLERLHSIVDKNAQCDDYQIWLHREDFDQIRFAANQPTQNIDSVKENYTLEASFSGKSTTIQSTDFSDESVIATLKKVEELARSSAENKEHMPSLGADQSVSKNRISEDFFDFSLSERMDIASSAIEEAKKRNIQCSGKVIATKYESGMATKNGLASDYAESGLFYEHTYQVDREASKIRRSSPNYEGFSVDKVTEKSISELELISPRKSYPTGRYPVVISASAAMQMMPFFVFYGGDKRAADEGRSPFSGKTGERVANENIQFFADPDFDKCPAIPFGHDGVKSGRHHFIKDGCLSELPCDRFWANQSDSTPWLYNNMIMLGSDQSDQDLIAKVENGFYITDIWYVRSVKVQDLTITGMTRNALFKIENGKLVGGCTHFRWNMSFFEFMKNIREVGRGIYGQSMKRPMYFPSMLVDDFYFASTTTA